jgi:hypothetical protein
VQLPLPPLLAPLTPATFPFGALRCLILSGTGVRWAGACLEVISNSVVLDLTHFRVQKFP